MKSLAYLLAAITVATFPVAGSQAATTMSRMTLVNDISRDLGVTATEFVACVQQVRPSIENMLPGPARQEARNGLLLPCIQLANPEITSEAFLAVMNKYQPAPPAN
jgi:hypothetical protein